MKTLPSKAFCMHLFSLWGGGVRTEGRGNKSQEYPYIASGLVLATGSDSCIDIKLHGVLAILYPSSCPNKPN